MERILAIIVVLTLLFSMTTYAEEEVQSEIDLHINDINIISNAIEEIKLNDGSASLKLQALANAVNKLDQAISTSGDMVTPDIVMAIQKAETAVDGTSGVASRNASSVIIAAKASMGITDEMYASDEAVKADEADKVLKEETLSKVAEAVSLSDVDGHWGSSYINRLIGLGSVAGYPDGTFKPETSVSVAAFVKMAYTTVEGADNIGNSSGHWAAGYMEAAIADGIIRESDFPQDDWNRDITRAEMTYIATQLTSKKLGEETKSTAGLQNVMNDYAEVQSSKYKFYIEQAYINGIITGVDAQGTFAGDSNGTRAQAATIIVRIVDDSFRKMPDLGTTVTTGTTIKAEDVDYTTVFKEGDTYVANNGNSYVLELDESGVLGVGNGISVWENFTHKNGTDLEHGSIMSDDAHFGQVYLEDSYGEGHSSGEWDEISDAQIKEAEKNVENPQDGDSYGKWLIFNGLFKGWEWTGPSA